jgi:hypothetical protein
VEIVAPLSKEDQAKAAQEKKKQMDMIKKKYS